MNQQFIDRINALPDVFMLASLVQFKYVQTISEPNDVNFVVGLAGGYEVFMAVTLKMTARVVHCSAWLDIWMQFLIVRLPLHWLPK